MFVSYKIAFGALSATTTATTINIPINIDYQIIDNSELIETVFVEDETQKAVNKILDYDKVRFTPVKTGTTTSFISNITYNINLLDANNTMQTPTYYSTADPKDPYTDDDIKFQRNVFKESFLMLSFYDDDNPLTQNLVTEIEIYSNLTQYDYWTPQNIPTPPPVYMNGQPKPANQIPLRFIASNPATIEKSFYEGFYIYNYKDEYVVGAPKYLYMKASFFNAKSGKLTNLMIENTKYPIDTLVKKQYTRYILYRDVKGFYYTLDTSYSNNISFTNTTKPNTFDISINLYQIQAL
jgi:hypothetical protein